MSRFPPRRRVRSGLIVAYLQRLVCDESKVIASAAGFPLAVVDRVIPARERGLPSAHAPTSFVGGPPSPSRLDGLAPQHAMVEAIHPR